MKKTRVHTILFTEACPLECKYCYLKDDQGYGSKPALSREMIFAELDRIDKEDDFELYNSRLLLTGGEPFLYPELIKEILEKYGHRFQYSFNTSGYCLTEEIIELLSHYRTTFILSVDGGARLTNYLRPTKTQYRTGYFKKLKQILPSLLYYFPATPFRMIVGTRYADLFFEQYLEAERAGFRKFSFVIDFESRPSKPIENKPIWTAAHTETLQHQFDLILEQIILGFKYNVSRPEIVELNNALKFILQGNRFNTEAIPCQVFAGRSLMSVQTQKNTGHCMSKTFPNLTEAEEALQAAYNKHPKKCFKDENCPVFEYCAHASCPKNSLDIFGEFFHFEELECVVNKIVFEGAFKLMSICNSECPESELYRRFISQFIKKEGH